MNQIACTQDKGFSAQALEEFRAVQDNYSYHVKAFCAFAADRPGTVLETIAGYWRELEASDLAASTIRCRRQAVKRRMRDAITDVDGKARAALDFELSRIDRAIRCPTTTSSCGGEWKVISPAEYVRLMDGARSDRQRRFIEVLWSTGLRISEMTGIRLTDCTVEASVVTVRIMGKGRKERTVYLTTGMYERCRECFSGSLYLFETGGGRRYSRSYVSNQIAKLTLKILGRRLSAHKLRHSFATRTIRETGNVGGVSRYLGHSDVALTLRLYDHNTLSPIDVLGPEAVAGGTREAAA